MSSSLSNTQSFPGLEALQQQPIDPQQPGPAETTRSPVSSPQVDNEFAWGRHWGRTYGSTASHQFHSQARREQDKLERQRRGMKAGRRQTQPWDDSFDIRSNAYNNVRNSWIEQGIWRKGWDEAWAKERDVGLSDQSPRSLTPEPTKSQPGYQWGHEDGGPPADQEFGPDPYRTIYVVGELGMSPEEFHQRLPKWYVQGSLDGPDYPIPYPRTRNSEGSRPYRQFLYQIVKEREWIKDEMDFKIQFRPYNVDLDSMAYETVKNNWIRDRIWKPEWNELPGSTWAHEDPLQEQDKVEYVGTVDDSGEQPSTVFYGPSKRPSELVDAWLGIPISQRRDPFSGRLLYPEVTQGCTDGTSNLEQASRDQKGTANSPQGGTRGSEFSFAATLGPQVQVQPPGSHGEASKSGGKSKLARGQSDSLDEQPPKRPRHAPQHSVPSSQEASDPAGKDKESLVPKGVTTKGEQLAKGETAGAASNPRRPRPRASDAVADQQGDVSNSAQTKGAKRHRPRRGDQHDTPRSAKRQKKSGKHGRGKK
ncbi:hypothetical protein NW759_005301 [Fusarium solani]|nr:hypothetical protein NW759_005301 [Fusarium solani]